MKEKGHFLIDWIDRGVAPKCKPDPAYPHGIDLDQAAGKKPSCYTELPYPTPRCGAFIIKCLRCGLTTFVTTAGRVDDPKSIRVLCKGIEIEVPWQ